MRIHRSPTAWLLVTILLAAFTISTSVVFLSEPPKPVGSAPTQLVITFNQAPTEAAQVSQSVWLVTTPDAQGSAVAVRHDGKLFFVTAAHVVDEHKTVRLSRPLWGSDFHYGRIEFEAKVVYTNSARDFALLKAVYTPEGLLSSVVMLHDVDYPAVGTPVLLVGNIYGKHFPLSVSRGIVAAHEVRPDHPSWPWSEQPLDQTDATGYPGVSGGGLFIDGQLAGVVVGMAGPNVLFYVPIRDIKGEIYDQIQM